MSDPLFSVAGKRVLVTGGTVGLGRMIVEGFATRGARVFIVSRKASMVDVVVDELAGTRGLDVVGLSANIADDEDVLRLVDAVGEHFDGGLDVLVNNAGATWGAKLEEYPLHGWDKVMDLNLRGLFELTKRCVPLLEKAALSNVDPSRVINIGSIAGIAHPSDNAFAYHASKAAVHHLSEVLAKTLASRHVNVNAVAPGVFPSKMTKHMFPGGDAGMISRMIPAGRPGTAEDIIGTLVYLSSRAGAYTTGAVIKVDGGASLSGAI